MDGLFDDVLKFVRNAKNAKLLLNSGTDCSSTPLIQHPTAIVTCTLWELVNIANTLTLPEVINCPFFITLLIHLLLVSYCSTYCPIFFGQRLTFMHTASNLGGKHILSVYLLMCTNIAISHIQNVP